MIRALPDPPPSISALVLQWPAVVAAAATRALERLAAESGVPARLARSRAEDVVASVQGALILSGGLADPMPFRRALRAIPDALLAPTPER